MMARELVLSKKRSAMAASILRVSESQFKATMMILKKKEKTCPGDHVFPVKNV